MERYKPSMAATLKRHRELADTAHMSITAGLDLEQRNGDHLKVLGHYLDGIELLTEALAIKFTSASDCNAVAKLNSEMQANLKRTKEHVLSISKDVKKQQTIKRAASTVLNL